MDTAPAQKRETLQTMIERSARSVRSKDFHGNGWGRRHYEAWQNPYRAHEPGIKAAVCALAALADAHYAMNDGPVGEDIYVGERWLDMLKATRGLLNADCGRFDCGTLDALLVAMAHAAGFDDEAL